jgi:hypothetical protein
MLPVTNSDPLTNIDPVISNVSALLSNKRLPVSLLNIKDPVTVSDPDIVTAWFSAETNDAVLASDAVAACEALIAFTTYDAV